MDKRKHILVIMGPAGCGKSTFALFLENELGLPVIEGDDYHPQASIAKMAAGTALTDTDRWDWLITLRAAALSILGNLKSNNPSNAVLVSCSALKKKYRDVFRIATLRAEVKVTFAYLKVGKEVLLERARRREGHFMKEEMVRGQLESLEEPDAEERDVVVLDGEGELESMAKELMKGLGKTWGLRKGGG